MHVYRKIIRFALNGLTALITVLATLYIAMYFTLQSDSLRTRLVDFLNVQLSTPNHSQIRIGNVHGDLFEHFVIDRVLISDKEGPWLQFENIAIEWNQWALLSGILDIKNINVASVRIDRIPESSDSARGDPRLPNFGILHRLIIHSSSIASISLESHGQVHDLIFAGTTTERKAINWSLDATYDQNIFAFSITKATLSTAFVHIDAVANYALHEQSGSGLLRINLEQLAPLSPILKQPISGSAFLETNIQVSDLGATLSGTVTGHIDSLSLHKPGIDKLFGPRITLRGDLRGTANQIQVQNLAVTAPAASLSTDFSLTPNSKALNGQYRLLAPNLANFSALLNKPVTGRLELEGTIRGSTDKTRLENRITLSALSIGKTDLGKLTAKLDLREFPSSSKGLLSFKFEDGRLDSTSGSTLFKLLNPRILQLDKLSLSSRGSSLTGDLIVPLNGNPTTGSLTCQLPSLTAWSNWLEQSLSGQATAHIDLHNINGSQHAHLKIQGENLTLSSHYEHQFSIRDALISVQFGDILSAPTGSADIILQGVKLFNAQLATLNAQARFKDLSNMTFDGQTSGSLNGPIELTLTGRLSRQKDSTKLELTRLDGLVANQPVTLKQKLSITTTPDNLTLQNLLLSIGKGKLSASAFISEQRLTGSIKLIDLPTEMVNILQPDSNVSGTLSANGHLLGSRQHPQARFTLEAKQIKLANPSNIARLIHDLRIHGYWQDNRMHIDARLTGFGDADAELTAAFPLQMAANSFGLVLPRQQTINGHLNWYGELAPVWEIITTHEDRFTGVANLVLKIRGTLSVPKISGRFQLAKASYENIETGTTLSDIEVELSSDNDRLVIERLAATDGTDGTLNGSGMIDLNSEMGFPLDIKLDFDNAQLITTDDLTVRAGGQLVLSGNSNKPTVSGTVVTQNIELNLENPLPPGFTELDVQEINLPAGQANKSSYTPQQTSNTPLGLDLKISAPSKVFVRGLGLDSEWRGNLAVTGNTDLPVVAGRLEPVRGFFSVWGKNFDLTRGSIRFSGTRKIDPLLNLSAEYKSSDLTAIVSVTGTALQPKIDLTSQPTMPQSDIASRVLFGTDAKSLTPAQSIQLATTASNLSGFGGSGNFVDTTRRMLGIDVLKFGESEIDAKSTRVSVGKYVADGVYVEIQQGTSRGSRTSATVELEVLPNITVKGGTTESGSNTVGFKWKWDY